MSADDMSFGGVRRHDATPTFPTKSPNEGSRIVNFFLRSVSQGAPVMCARSIVDEDGSVFETVDVNQFTRCPIRNMA